MIPTRKYSPGHILSPNKGIVRKIICDKQVVDRVKVLQLPQSPPLVFICSKFYAVHTYTWRPAGYRTTSAYSKV